MIRCEPTTAVGHDVWSNWAYGGHAPVWMCELWDIVCSGAWAPLVEISVWEWTYARGLGAPLSAVMMLALRT